MLYRRHSLSGIAVLAAALIALTGACDDMGGEELAGPRDTQPAAQSTEGDRSTGQARNFTANLTPLNGDLSFRPVHGSVAIQVEDGQISVRIDAEGLEPGIPHPQHIHGKMGVGSCPDASDDQNGDGVIDVVEGLPDYGGILVTLDSDLTNGATTEVDGLPKANRAGVIHYRQTADLSAVEAGASRNLNLEQRHIVLHGVDPDLQDTALSDAASIGDLPAWLTLPVACGELVPEGRGTAPGVGL